MQALVDGKDLLSYKANVTNPLESTIGHETYFFPAAPFSGALVQFMLTILKGYELDESKKLDELTYHRIIETMKHAYAVRTVLADPNFYPDEIEQLYRKCNNEKDKNGNKVNLSRSI